jgi:hypothetical protein
MSQTVLNRTAEGIAESARQASRATSGVADAIIEDGVGVARHAAKQGGDAAEEFVNDTSQRIQRHPALTVRSHVCRRLHSGSVHRLDDQTKVALAHGRKSALWGGGWRRASRRGQRLSPIVSTSCFKQVWRRRTTFL